MTQFVANLVWPAVSYIYIQYMDCITLVFNSSSGRKYLPGSPDQSADFKSIQIHLRSDSAKRFEKMDDCHSHWWITQSSHQSHTTTRCTVADVHSKIHWLGCWSCWVRQPSIGWTAFWRKILNTSSSVTGSKRTTNIHELVWVYGKSSS